MANKYCSKCSEDLPISMFYKKSSRSDGLQSHCRDCQKVYKDSYYKRNSKAIIKAVGIGKRKRALKHYRKIINDYFAGGCVRCKNNDFRVLEFDHVNGKKQSARGTEGVMSFVREGYSWGRIETEINKCVVLCCNCHKIKTYREGNYWRDLTHECKR